MPRSQFKYTLERGNLSRDVDVEVDYSYPYNSFTGYEAEVEIIEVRWHGTNREISEELFAAVKPELLDHAYDAELLS